MELTDVVCNYYRGKNTLFTEPIISKDTTLHKQETIYFLHILSTNTSKNVVKKCEPTLYNFYVNNFLQISSISK